jgi:hypothetical protein
VGDVVSWDEPITVVHCGTGYTGTHALRSLLTDPRVRLVGQLVSTPAKAGVDSGELCGRAPVGVQATQDLASLLALKADCLCYAASTVGRERAAVDDIARFLSAGTNVVTFALPSMSYPPAAPEDLRAIIADACRHGHTSFFASGSDPGALSMNVPAAMLSMAGEVEAYTMEIHALDLAKSYPLESVLRTSMGFGQPDGTVPSRVSSGDVERTWTPVVRFIADFLGFRLDAIRLSCETSISPAAIETPAISIERDTIGAHRWQLQGLVGGRAVVTVEYLATLTADVPRPADWPTLPEGVGGGLVYKVRGKPSYQLLFQTDKTPGETVNGSIAMTALAAVNAIQLVVAAPPQHLAATDLSFFGPPPSIRRH